MAVTVEQLIEKLKTLPKDTTIDVLKQVSSGYSSYSTFVDLESIDDFDGFEILDFREESFKTSPFYGKVYVRFGIE